MNCPRCGKVQPFDVKCVHCNTDIASVLNSEKQSLFYYRIALLFLFLFSLWLGISRTPSKSPAIPDAPLIKAQSREIQESNRQLVEQQDVDNPRNLTQNSPQITAFLNRKSPLHHQILEGFRLNYSAPIRLRNVDEKIPYLRENEVVLGIGREAMGKILDEKPKTTIVLLSPSQDLGEVLDPNQNTIGLGGYLPVDLELKILMDLFPRERDIILISSEDSEPPSDQLLRQFDLSIKTYPPDSILLEQELNISTRSNQIVWLHQISQKDLAPLLELEPLTRALTFYGLPSSEESSEEIGEGFETESNPLVAITLSPFGLGKEGAILLREFLNRNNLNLFSRIPKDALEIQLHVNRALELQKDYLINQIHQRGLKEGYQIKLLN